MSTARRLNITLPEDVAEILNNVKNKSAFIAEAIREYKKQKDKEKLIAELKEGYLLSAKEDIELSKDWEVTINDGI
ncbi:hypothetical protein JCM14244_16090 [Venenivibrio stagnispumantis]|uniref:Uncharacterized protein n=1 Tax=Venenivibrio stagnispumantis TaxID=407998 RepID=A0AA45WJL6_9AQUI|nr:hypothetical protein [Venenivibrio stagnispumantis]MCW4572410.1 hypothetical protein [Venenivibrio stagnispumantis]SMP03593.1 hypothetical protein SAMN06264868_102144 [Venenivibrio stagnispumantis]